MLINESTPFLQTIRQNQIGRGWWRVVRMAGNKRVWEGWECPFLLIIKMCLIYLNKEFMSSQNQCVISLSKLTLPDNLHTKKLTLSVLTSAQQIFIQNHKNVKNHKINFYRENLFLKSLPHQLCFNLYQVDDSANLLLIKQLKVPSPQLREIKVRPSAFRTQHQAYELDWEAWIFTEDSEELNEPTERDYSELQLPFYNREQLQENSVLQNSTLNEPNPASSSQNMKKRSSSTEGSTSPNAKQQPDNDHRNMHWRGSLVENKAKSPCKQRTKIKSHLYCGLVKMASELFSQSSAS